MQTITDILIDSSSSMGEPWVGGQTRAEIVKDLLRTVILPSLSQNSLVSLRWFGGGCEVRPITEPIPYSESRFAELLECLPLPHGRTPLCKAIAASLDAIFEAPYSQRQIVVLSDGEESCGGNFASLLTRLKQSQADFSNLLQVYTIAVDPENSQLDQLREISAATGTKPFLISTPADVQGVKLEVERIVNAVLEDRPLEPASSEFATGQSNHEAEGKAAIDQETSGHDRIPLDTSGLAEPKQRINTLSLILDICVFALWSYIAYQVFINTPSASHVQVLEQQNAVLKSDLTAAQERVNMQKRVIDALTTQLTKMSGSGGQR